MEATDQHGRASASLKQRFCVRSRHRCGCHSFTERIPASQIVGHQVANCITPRPSKKCSVRKCRIFADHRPSGRQILEAVAEQESSAGAVWKRHRVLVIRSHEIEYRDRAAIERASNPLLPPDRVVRGSGVGDLLNVQDHRAGENDSTITNPVFRPLRCIRVLSAILV